MFGCEARRAAALTSRRNRSTMRLVAQQVAADDLEGDRPVHQPMLGPVDGPHAAGAEGGDDPVARVVAQLRGEPGEGRRIGRRAGDGRLLVEGGRGRGADDKRRRDLEARRRFGSRLLLGRRCRGRRGARPRSFATSESSGWSRITWQHESQADRCCSISSISGSSSRP